VEVCPVQLPGRDSRIAEPPFADLSELVRATGTALHRYFDKPFAFFGHSMGALLAFELTRQLRAEYDLSPEHLFVSGRAAPQLERTGRPVYDLPEDELLQELRELNGTPPEVLAHPELMKLMLPMLRADFALYDTYAYADGPPLTCPVTALGGLRDAAVPRASLQAWHEQTRGPFSLSMFPGDHFFLHSDKILLLGVLVRAMQRLVGLG
jgi:medium-chain acyl-[acyl-carrier-protein] hydrolase